MNLIAMHNEGSCALCTGWHDAEEAAFMNRRRPPVSGEPRRGVAPPTGLTEEEAARWDQAVESGEALRTYERLIGYRPPVSGEPPQPQVHDETCTHPEEQRRTQVIEEPTIYEVCSACEHVMAIRTDRASTGAALDAETLAWLIATYEFQATDEWAAWGSLLDRLMSIHGQPGDGSRREAAAMLEHLIRLAEQEGEGS